MGNIGEAGFVLNLSELIFLAALTGGKEIYGVENKKNYSDENEIAQEWKNVRKQLENKKYIEVELDGSIIIDNDLYFYVKQLCEPLVFIKILVNVEGKQHARNFYFTASSAVELDEDRLMKTKYYLSPMVSIEKVANNFKEFCHIEKIYKYVKESLKLSVLDIERYNNQVDISERNTEIDKFEKLGCSREAARDLFDALFNKQFYLSTVVTYIKDSIIDDIKALSIIGGNDYLWKVELDSNSNSNDEIEVRTFNINDIANEIESLLSGLNGRVMYEQSEC